MTPAFEKIPAAIPPCPGNSGKGRVAHQCRAPHERFFWRQLDAAGLAAVAENVAAGHDLDLEDALALSRASLPLLGKIVQLRATVLSSLRNDVSNFPPAACEAGATGEVALPIERVASLPESPRRIGQALTEWDSFCRTLIATRDEIPSTGLAIYWYPIVGQPLGQDLGYDGGYSGVEALRAIALARLILPAEIEVLAPLATLGPKLAQVALDFGASHLGYVAPDGQMPSDPLIAAANMLEELLRSISRTEISAPADPGHPLAGRGGALTDQL